MTAIGLLGSLRVRDIVITADDGDLSVDAPAGALTDEDRARLRECKAELLAILRGGATPSRIRENSTSGHARGSERDLLHPLNQPAPIVGEIHDRPRLGSMARPAPVRGTRMPMDCLWDTCDGSLTGKGHRLYQCGGCETWFELRPPEDLGVFVGDLADDLQDVSADAIAELVM
jgi:hypothetical protein